MEFHLNLAGTMDARARHSIDAARSNTPTPAPANSRAMLSDSIATTPLQEADRQLGSSNGAPTVAIDRRILAIPDPVMFKSLLDDDPSVSVIHRKHRLDGYELYLVEQWACNRTQPTTVIVTYTGDTTQSVAVGVLSVPRDESAWSDLLRVYLKTVQQYHARPKDTPLGELMVTNLSSFPSALTVIAVPDGDIRKHRHEFVVNENLKRLGCSGRSGMSLSEPTAAARAKFYQLYKVNDKIPFDEAVVELVKLCQVALYIFDNLHAAYVDGLLCDVTEAALTDWWTEFGADYYNMEPADGILGPTTVSALLGLCVGARNRLSYLNFPVSKDVFDVDATERGIAYYQKYHKMERTRKLDRQTMHKLHNATAKAAAGEAWGVQKAVKSTVTEIGGKRGEIVLGMVGGRDKGGIGDIESLDLNRFINLVSGERAKWLWLGKPKKPGIDNNHDRPTPGREPGSATKDDSTSHQRRTQITPQDDLTDPLRKDETGVYSTPAPGSAVSVGESPGNKDQLRRGVLKNVARDARSGLGRIKDAVSGSGRSHGTRPSRDDSGDGLLSPISGTSTGQVTSSGSGITPINRAFTWKNKPEEYMPSLKEKHGESAASSLGNVAGGGPSNAASHSSMQAMRNQGQDADHFQAPPRLVPYTEDQNGISGLNFSAVNSTADEAEMKEREPDRRLPSMQATSRLHRRHSVMLYQTGGPTMPRETRWPRRMSFSDVEAGVLRWDLIAGIPADPPDEIGMTDQERIALMQVATALFDNIVEVNSGLAPWVTNKVAVVKDMDQKYAKQVDDLQALYYQQSETFQQAKHDSQEMLSQERSHLTEATGNLKNLLNRLEYELAILSSRVQDVDDGLANFEIQVEDMERRADELKRELETETWLHWAVRTLTGIGTGPNITQSVAERQ